MRAFRESNTNTGVDILLQSEYDALMEKDPKVMYITYALADDLNTTDCTLVIANVYVGTQEHDVLVNNAGQIVWMRSSYIIADYYRDPYDDPITLTYEETRGFDSAGDPITLTGTVSGRCTGDNLVNSFRNEPIPLHQLV